MLALCLAAETAGQSSGGLIHGGGGGERSRLVEQEATCWLGIRG
jgi:hypothetical protein